MEKKEQDRYNEHAICAETQASRSRHLWVLRPFCRFRNPISRKPMSDDEGKLEVQETSSKDMQPRDIQGCTTKGHAKDVRSRTGFKRNHTARPLPLNAGLSFQRRIPSSETTSNSQISTRDSHTGSPRVRLLNPSDHKTEDLERQDGQIPTAKCLQPNAHNGMPTAKCPQSPKSSPERRIYTPR